jgi:hypothetical protein
MPKKLKSPENKQRKVPANRFSKGGTLQLFPQMLCSGRLRAW